MTAHKNYTLASAVAELTPHQLTTWRQGHGVTLSALAQAAGVSVSTVSDIETYRRAAGSETQAKILAAVEDMVPGSSTEVAFDTRIETIARANLGAPVWWPGHDGSIVYRWPMPEPWVFSILAEGDARSVLLTDSSSTHQHHVMGVTGPDELAIGIIKAAREIQRRAGSR